MNIRLASLGAALVLILNSGVAWGVDENTDSSQLPDADKSFLDLAAAGDKAEIELSKVAVTKSRTPAIRTFAQQMITDHGRNYRDLQALCDKKKYAIAPELDAGHRVTLRKLQSIASDDAFDRAYVDAMVADHAGIDSLLDQAANNSSDSDIKQFAADSLLVVKKHEQMATDLAAK